MRVLPALALLVAPGLVLAALLVAGAPPEERPLPELPVARTEHVERAPVVVVAPASHDRATRIAETLRAYPGRAVVSCPLKGRLRFSVMPLHVHLDTPGDPAPADYAVVEDALVVTIPPGRGAVNLSTGDGAGIGRFAWPEVAAGQMVECTSFRWTEGPLVVPGLVRGAPERGASVRACGEDGKLTPVSPAGSFSLSLTRSEAICRVRVEAGARVGAWKEVRADRLDGTIWLDLPK